MEKPAEGVLDVIDVAASEPYYLPLADEVAEFEAAYASRLPVLLKGPTGCGKTRFVEHMTWRLFGGDEVDDHLVTVSCHEDLTGTDLVGRYLLKGDETVWQDGPLTQAVRDGSLCYLDEIVEARKDTTVLIHSLTDHRRVLPIDKTGELLRAHDDFLLVISYNPGYQSILKDLKTSTRQRFVSLTFDYPDEAREAEIVAHESGVEASVAERLASAGATVEEIPLPASFAYAHACQRIVSSIEAAAVHEEHFRTRADEYGPRIRNSIEMGMLVPAVSYLQAQRLRREFQQDMIAALSSVDAALLPSAPAPAPRDLNTTGDAVFQVPWTSSGLPSVSIPSGLSSDGLPLGVQLAGLPLQEGPLLGVARWCESALGVSLWPPDYA